MKKVTTALTCEKVCRGQRLESRPFLFWLQKGIGGQVLCLKLAAKKRLLLDVVMQSLFFHNERAQEQVIPAK